MYLPISISRQMRTDASFGFTSDYQAKMHSDDAPVYYYIYDYTPDNFIFPDHLGESTFSRTTILLAHCPQVYT